MSDQSEFEEIEQVWEEGCAAIIPEKSKFREKYWKKELEKHKIFKECRVLLKRADLQAAKLVLVGMNRRNSFLCYTCWKVFKHKHELNRHKYLHKQKAKKALKEKKYVNKTNDTGEVINNNKTNKEEEKTINAPQDEIQENNYKCETCNAKFTSVEDVKKHPKNNCKFKCNICNRSCNTTGGFVVHILQHKMNISKPTCKDCNSTFANFFLLKTHTILVHKAASLTEKKEPGNENVESNKDTDEEDLSCELCFDMFNSRKELDVHMEFHNELLSNRGITDGI